MITAPGRGVGPKSDRLYGKGQRSETRKPVSAKGNVLMHLSRKSARWRAWVRGTRSALAVLGMTVGLAWAGRAASLPPPQAGEKLAQPPAAGEVPAEWVEPSGHRVLRLTGKGGGSSFYFHQN